MNLKKILNLGGLNSVLKSKINSWKLYVWFPSLPFQLNGNDGEELRCRGSKSAIFTLLEIENVSPVEF